MYFRYAVFCLLGKKNDTLFEQVFKFRQWIFYISLLYPLKKGRAFHLNKIESPFPINALCQVWFNSAQSFRRRRWKCENITDRRTDRLTDDG